MSQEICRHCKQRIRDNNGKWVCDQSPSQAISGGDGECPRNWSGHKPFIVPATQVDELAKLRADNKALLDAAKGVVKLLSEPSPFYLKKLGGPITNGDQKQIDDVFIALDAAIEHSEPQ